jgi:hypothetical protein
MVIIKEISIAVEIDDNCIMIYDLIDNEVNISTQSKLISGNINYIESIKNALNIKDIKIYGVDILN